MKVVALGSSGLVESEAQLAARFAREAMPLFDVLSRRARCLTSSDADADDLLQDTLLHAYAGFRGFDADRDLELWLFRMLYNRWVKTHHDELSTRRRRRVFRRSISPLAG